MSRNGRKAFNRCDVKVVEIKRRLRDKVTNLVIDETARESGKNYALNGHGAELHCPRTEDDRVAIKSDSQSHSSQAEALASVRGLAGQLLCAECRYSSMTPVQVSIERTELAKAEADRVVAFQALEAARAEIAVLENPEGYLRL